MGLLAAVVAVAVMIPALYLLVRVSDDWAHSWETISSARALGAALDTAIFALAVAGGTLLIAIPAAWLTTRTDLPFARAWFVLLSLPLAIPSYVSALTIVLFLGPRGILQGWLEPLGIERLPSIYGFWGAWAALVFFTYPYVLLPARAAFQSMDRSLEEAARSLGLSPAEAFLRVTLPQLRPALVAGGLIVVLYALSDFGAVSILRFDSLSRLIYLQYSGTLDRQAAAALGLLLAVIAVLVVTAETVTRGRARYHASASPRRPRTVRLGRWKWGAMAYLGLLVAFSLAIPIGVLAYHVNLGLQNDLPLQSLRTPAWNTIYAALLAAFVTVVAALPIGYLAARRPSPISRLLERLSYAGFALPGIVVALALVFAASRYAPWIYQTLPLLVFAFAVRFLPEAHGPARDAFLRINPRTEEAGRSLGRGPVAIFFRVTLPQLLPGLSAGWLLVFLTAIKELPITLLLSPLGFDTLAVQVWSNSTEVRYASASYAALALVIVASIPVLVMALRERGRA